MSTYAYAPETRALLATWSTGGGDHATTIATLDPDVAEPNARALAHALSELSAALWRTYTHPAAAAGDDLGLNTEGWRRDEHRQAFAVVPAALTNPNLPYEDDSIITSYNPVEESAHIVGRALHEIGSAEITAAVMSDVEAEIQAVIDAESGNLSGRARQAVALTRAGPSPVQVMEAYRILEADPLGSERLFTDVEPAAAAIAAAHWLLAAAHVAAAATGTAITDVVVEADNIEALQVETPTFVLESLDAGETPRDVVTNLISIAMTVAEGRIPDPAELMERLAEALAKAKQHGAGVEEFLPRLSLLDPARPAPDLLEDLLSGIRGCWLLYGEASENYVGDEDQADEGSDDVDVEINEEFLAAVRAEANAARDRLN